MDITSIAKKSDSTVAAISGPGTGIVITQGPHKGRKLIPMHDGSVNESNEVGGTSYSLFSDDDGFSWQTGDFAPIGDDNAKDSECQVVELDEGNILLNARTNSRIGYRKVAFSNDGGFSWSKLINQIDLKDSGCMGSILRYSWPSHNKPGVIIYSGSAIRVEGTKRGAGTVWISFDEGNRWPIKKLIYPDKFDYSSLVKLPNGNLGMLAELDFNGERLEICFLELLVMR